ncbi:acyl-CoA dehydrogenase family protein [Mycolicibacterium sp.]|uniref:acyl-CoA dehydrogenase family protein n=1 Tax=Mycolicibacterium sp. TaxID=2320850 RepID=UPI001A359B79|nr:acyl-CoA dehydrogenase family protein [Mycolicibacterium sp.]MBJ7338370.1 acyl-CoA/acyl-ACP dehydrogenase [Mycolicibacterium sp.]
MSSELSEFHDELRTIARQLLAKGGDRRQIVDAGWAALEIPEALGGSGASFVETSIILEEMGRAAADHGLLGTTLAVGALTALAPNTSRDAVLERIAAGATAAFAPGFTVSDGVVSGLAEFVPGAADADVVLLLADLDGSPAVITATGLSVTAQPVLDETRSLAHVVADGAEVSEIWPLTVSPETLRHRAAVSVACDSLGVAEAMLAATVDYASVRHQFGRAIGSFQAVKHACADMLVRLAVARQLTTTAVDALAAGDDADVATAMAKSYACAAAVDVVGKAMQLHGGIGYTWESGVHVYLKRAMLNRSLYGSPAAHRKRLAARYV